MMQKDHSQKFILHIVLLCGTLLLPWAFMQFETRIPGDAAYLYTGAKYFLSGMPMKDFYYDNNPPLCYLIYLPAVLLEYLGFSAPRAITLYTFILILLSSSFVAYFVSYIKDIDNIDKNIILSGFVCGITLYCFSEFSQKDQLISIAILPFLLAQRALTQDNKMPRIIPILCLILCTPFILVKPHFGIMPAALMAYDFIKNRNPYIIVRADFICLALGVILYAIISLFYFPDYIFEILPQAYHLYAIQDISGLSSTKPAIAFFFIGLILFAILMIDDNAERKKQTSFFALMALLATIPFWVQNKGFSLHMLPILPFLLISCGLAARQILPKYDFSNSLKAAASAILILSSGYIMILSRELPATHAAYENSTLAELIKNNAGTSPFFFEAYSTNIFYTQSLYLENIIGSRFSSLWLLNSVETLPEQREEELTKLGNMLHEDILRFKPAIIGLKENDDGQNFITTTFKDHKNLQNEWQNYSYHQDFTIHRSEIPDFMIKTDTELKYRIYLRDIE